MANYRKNVNGEYVYFNNNSIVDEDKRIFNPTHEQLIAAGWEVVAIPIPTEAELLKQAIDNKINEVLEYDSSDAINQFTVNEEDTWVEATLRAQLRISIQAYQALEETEVTKVWNGKEYTFSVTEWLLMLNQVEKYASECFNMTQRHIANISVLQDIAEVEAYDYTVGYPEKLVFTEEN